MTIEEEFYKTFNINKTSFDFTCNKKHCNKKRLIGRFVCLECNNETKKEIKVYSEITDRILLELICILNKHTGETTLTTEEYKDIKKEILKEILFTYEQMRKPYKKELTNQVQKLFKEEE